VPDSTYAILSRTLSQNWRAKPLVSYRVIVELISATTTKTPIAAM
jgi:hypothetical protein